MKAKVAVFKMTKYWLNLYLVNASIMIFEISFPLSFEMVSYTFKAIQSIISLFLGVVHHEKTHF